MRTDFAILALNNGTKCETFKDLLSMHFIANLGLLKISFLLIWLTLVLFDANLTQLEANLTCLV